MSRLKFISEENIWEEIMNIRDYNRLISKHKDNLLGSVFKYKSRYLVLTEIMMDYDDYPYRSPQVYFTWKDFENWFENRMMVGTWSGYIKQRDLYLKTKLIEHIINE